MQDGFSKNSNILIVGLGLIGGSIALALKKVGYKNIYAVDINEKTLKYAWQQEIIQKTTQNTQELLRKADLVILAIYPWHAKEFLQNNLAEFKSTAVVIDTSGIKEKLLNEVHTFWRKDIDFIAIHQMAGKEQGGIENACDNLFVNTNFIVIEQEINRPENIQAVIQLAKEMQVKEIVKLSAQEHDRIIAYTSNLTHLLAVALVNSPSLSPETKSFIGGSFRDVSRVALINSSLWTQLLLANSTNVLAEIKVFKEQLELLEQAIANSATADLQELLIKANRNRGELCKK